MEGGQPQQELDLCRERRRDLPGVLQEPPGRPQRVETRVEARRPGGYWQGGLPPHEPGGVGSGTWVPWMESRVNAQSQPEVAWEKGRSPGPSLPPSLLPPHRSPPGLSQPPETPEGGVGAVWKTGCWLQTRTFP